MLIYLILFVAFLFLPGWCVLRIFSPRLSGYLSSFAVSLALLTANIVVIVHFRIPLAVFTPAVIVETLLLACWAALSVGPGAGTGQAIAWMKEAKWFLAGAVLTTATIMLHIKWAGIYTEVPADVWRHLGYTQWAYQSFEGTRSPLPVNLWYYIPAWFRYLAGGDVFAFIHGFGTVNTLVQSLAIYVFSHHIARRLVAGDGRAAVIAWLSVVLAAFSIGVNAFSYLRYYTFGPMMQSMMLYFFCVILTLEIFERRRFSPDVVLLLAGLAATLCVLHIQEAALLYGLLLAMSLVTLARFIHRRFRKASARGSNPRNVSPRSDLYFASAVVIGTLVLFFVTHFTVPIRGTVQPWIVPLSEIVPTGIHLFVADPAYQVYQSITIWGLFVYILFFVYWKTFSRNLYVLSGMLIPLVTFFNPVFVDMFLRHSEAAPIYRFAYAVPLHIVAACCLTGAAAPPLRMGAISGKIAWAATACLLIALLLPNGLPLLHNTNSRVPTLMAVPAGNDYTHWRDMLEYLRTVEQTRVITDPVTAYMLRGTTSHRAPGYKFHQVHVSLSRDADYYSRFSGALLVMNKRNGASSGNGARAGHWPKDVLATSSYYPPDLGRSIAEQPGKFQLVWERDGIRIYRIESRS